MRGTSRKVYAGSPPGRRRRPAGPLPHGVCGDRAEDGGSVERAESGCGSHAAARLPAVLAGGCHGPASSHAAELVLVLLVLLVLTVGGSPAAAGLLGMVAVAVETVLGPVAGVVADRRSRRWIMLVSAAVSFVAFGGLTVAGQFLVHGR